MRVGVLEPWQAATDRPNFHLKMSIAEDLVARGHAVWAVPRKRIQKIVAGNLPILPRAPKQLGMRVSKWSF